MPFIGTERLRKLEKRKIFPSKLGDLCALAYKPMVEKWLENPSWTTWSRIRMEVYNHIWRVTYLDSRYETWNWKAGQLFTNEDAQNQVEAAAEVFYSLYVLQYEIDKRTENGGVIDDEN